MQKKLASIFLFFILVQKVPSSYSSPNTFDPNACSVDFAPDSSPKVAKLRMIRASDGLNVGETTGSAGIFKIYTGTGALVNYYVEVQLASGVPVPTYIGVYYYGTTVLNSPPIYTCNTVTLQAGSWYRITSSALPYGCRPSGQYLNNLSSV